MKSVESVARPNAVWQAITKLNDTLLGAAMDGLHKLIEMLEKRYGRLPADVFLLIVVAGAASWALNMIASALVIPVVGFIGSVWAGFTGHPIQTPSMQTISDWVNIAFFAPMGTWILFGAPRQHAREMERMAAEIERLKVENAVLKGLARDLSQSTS